jgi:type IV pilus assembly protein PilX
MANMIFRAPHRAQRGAVLITSIIFMLVLTMLVIAMIRGGTLEERMARNSRDQQKAMQAAESVLREAEAYVTKKNGRFDPFDLSSFTATCTDGVCFKPNTTAQWDTIDWDSTSLTRTFENTASNIDGVASQPRYMVEVVTPPVKTSSAAQCDAGVVKITARGVGSTGSIVYLQSYVRFRVFSNSCL